MILAEECLLSAVLTRLRLPVASGGAGFSQSESEVEYDELAPSTTGDTYAAIVPGGVSPGKYHQPSGGVYHGVVTVDVVVVKRATSTARDKQRGIFHGNLLSLTRELERVLNALDYKQDVRALANTLYGEATNTTIAEGTGFIKPLVFSGRVGKPETVSGDFFAARAKEATAGLKRRITFGGAEWMLTRS